MRTIKFRAWIENKKYMAVQGTPDLETLHSFMFHYGNSENLMQFTGLYDKNGKEIYEGDILYHKIQGFRFVEFGSNLRSYAAYMVVNKEGMRGTLQDTERLYEIIGNIHENHELLK